MSQSILNHKFSTILLASILTALTGYAQGESRPQPVWWFGQSLAANFNFYRGTTQGVSESLTTPTAFHKGRGVRPYFSLLAEYRPNRVMGGMLNIAYDGRGGRFNGVMAPCNCAAELSTNLSYLSVEPSFRLAPFASAFYIFAGPVLSINLTKEYTYTQEKQADRRGDWSDIRSAMVSAQAGAGADIPLSARTNTTQITLSPFASFLTDINRDPRSDASWSVYTVRGGMALKFGSLRNAPQPADNAPSISDKEVAFSVRAPKVVPYARQVKETFPLRNSVFFDIGSTDIPTRYIALSKAQAASFNEAQLQQEQPRQLSTGRSSRQLAVYHNILNILGDRLSRNPETAITLTGASYKNPAEGKLLADNVKQYLVTRFGINPSRIHTEGRDKPAIPSEQPGVTKDLTLLREGDRRVDIESVSPAMLLQVGGSTPLLKPVQIIALQEDPLDSHVIFNNTGASDLLKSWTIEITDEQGQVQRYGPYINDQATVSGKTILGNNPQGNYKVVMLGQAKDGNMVRKESSVSLTKRNEATQQGLRYSILFDFDRSKTINSYANFLTDFVAPLIPNNATVIVHGHTDIIGEEKYNQTLSTERATGARQLLEAALQTAGKRGVSFETTGFGEDESMALFGNELPEQRFYNRTVIIDIIPND